MSNTASGYAVNAIRAEQSIGFALVAGLVTALFGALLWAGICIITNMELGIVAVFVGYIVGQAVRYTGKGIDTYFGLLGAACSGLACFVGNGIIKLVFDAHEQLLTVGQYAARLDAQQWQGTFMQLHSQMDLLFYAIAIYEGYKFSFKYKLAKPD